ncbi:MAG: hypothetical protein ABI999_15600 [Acidobacteriota bacterium]
MIRTLKIFPVSVLILLAALTAAAQTKGRKPLVKKPVANPIASDPQPIASPTPATLPGKRNERPDAGQASSSNGKSIAVVSDPSYFYVFEQPKFTITKITIKHDDTGKGELTFKKGEFDEPITEPIKLSQTTLDKIAASIAALDFLNSNENYQYEKDYSHLGNITFRLRKDGREREIHFNYTTNKDAKDLADEYRRISNQIIWVFDMNVARENQPLDAPRQMDALESYMQRNEIADPTQLLEFLRSLSQDERIPLIARNHAGKIIKKIEKDKK